MAMQLVTYYLKDYKMVLKKSSAIEALHGNVVVIKVNESVFDDPKNVFRYNYKSSPYKYKLVAKIPMNAAIKFC